jgi:hypothetical protein
MMAVLATAVPIGLYRGRGRAKAAKVSSQQTKCVATVSEKTTHAGVETFFLIIIMPILSSEMMTMRIMRTRKSLEGAAPLTPAAASPNVTGLFLDHGHETHSFRD